MLLLDSNHLDALLFAHERGEKFAARLASAAGLNVEDWLLDEPSDEPPF